MVTTWHLTYQDLFDGIGSVKWDWTMNHYGMVIVFRGIRVPSRDPNIVSFCFHTLFLRVVLTVVFCNVKSVSRLANNSLKSHLERQESAFQKKETVRKKRVRWETLRASLTLKVASQFSTRSLERVWKRTKNIYPFHAWCIKETDAVSSKNRWKAKRKGYDTVVENLAKSLNGIPTSKSSIF